jgi:hypothetical protein
VLPIRTCYCAARAAPPDPAATPAVVGLAVKSLWPLGQQHLRAAERTKIEWLHPYSNPAYRSSTVGSSPAISSSIASNGVDDDERRALQVEGLDPDDPAVIAAIDLARWELSLWAGGT